MLDETTNSSFANKNLGEVLKQQGLTLEEFNKLRLTDVKDLTKEQNRTDEGNTRGSSKDRC